MSFHRTIRTIIRLSALLAVVALAKGCGDGESPSAPPMPEPARPTTVTVSPATYELTALGATVQLSAEVRDQNNRVMAGATVTWTSSASSVATVDASGLVTAAGNGTATITASAGSASGSAAVTVTQSVASVEVSPATAELTAVGATVQLTAAALDGNGHAVAGAEFSWESSDVTVATVDASGLVTAAGNGTATITASAGSASGSAVVTVTQSVATVDVSPATAELTAVGATVQLTAAALGGNGHAVAGAEFSWESSDVAVATVDASGLVTAAGNGTATITASAGSASGSAVVTVTQSVATVDVSPATAELTAVGATVQLTAAALDGNGHAVAGAEFSWESSDAAVATVDASGLVTAAGNGTATITASAGSAQTTAEITVDLNLDQAPPAWVFAGNVPESDQLMLREEMEYARAYFASEFGVEATGFTVLVGENYEALSPVYREVVGTDLSNHYHSQAEYVYAWVTASAHGSAVVTLMYGLGWEPATQLRHHISHEYFHVLQGQLASGFAQLENGEIGWYTNVRRDLAPQWLVEGLASYADYSYTPSRPGREPFLGRYSPFKDLGWAKVNGEYNVEDLARSVNYANAICTFGDHYFYGLSFVAALFLAEQAPEDSYVDFWRLLGERSTWRQAFEEAFGTSVDDFVQAFEEWLPSQIPSYDQVTIQMLWPDMGAHPQIPGEFLYLGLHEESWEGNSNPERWWSTGSRGFWEPTLYLTITYPAGAIGTAIVSLWWSDDQSTRHLLGWYKDGELTDQLAEATPIEFTGVSRDIEWTLPAHPNTIRRLPAPPR